MVGSLLKYMLFCLNPVNILKNKQNTHTHTHTHTHKINLPLKSRAFFLSVGETFGRTFRTVLSKGSPQG